MLLRYALSEGAVVLSIMLLKVSPEWDYSLFITLSEHFLVRPYGYLPTYF